MAEQWGDELAIAVSKRIGRFVDTSSDLDNLPVQDADDGRLFLAMDARIAWIYDKDSTASAGTYIRVPADARTSGRFARIDATLAAAVAGLASDTPGLTCASGLAVNDWVYVSAASTVAKADADAPLIPAIGMIVSKESSTSCTVRASGLATGLSGLTAGSTYYLSTTAGAITATPPATPNASPVGVAVSTTALLILPAGTTFATLRSTTANLGASVVGINDTGSIITATTVEAALQEVAQFEVDLGSIVNGKGASKVAIEDAGAFTASATVEAASAEIYQHLKSIQVVLPFNLAGAILAAGTPLAAFADNASSNPGITLDNSKAVGIRWNNNATQTAVWMSVALPLDLDPTAAMTLVVLAAKSGATSGDAVTFLVTAFAQTVAALQDAGSDLGGTTGAMTGTSTAKTVQRVTLSIATPPTPPAVLSLSIKPTNGTLGTDDVTVHGLWLQYKRKLLTS